MDLQFRMDATRKLNDCYECNEGTEDRLCIDVHSSVEQLHKTNCELDLC
jgi:hypothetical protein